ncbi:MAG: CCA tRNA nucleotidyltransferase [Candidatus Aenigmatarchaeota archaeon]
MVKLDRYAKVLAGVLKKVKPSPAEEKEMEGVMGSVVAVARKHANPMVCGSSVKGTWLSGRNELDLFLLYPPALPRKQLEEKGVAAAKAIVKELGGTFVIAYAEHPYVRGKISVNGKAFDIDVVPCYDVKDPAKIKSAVDRTPHHVRFVNANIGRKGDEVRLLKQFCKGIGVYGADTRTQGISGYICELLILAYGSFEAVLREASNWRPPHAVGKGAEKFDSPLVIIDPVDSNRNAAAAVSAENFSRFVFEARRFMKNPNERFFFPKIKKLTKADIDKLVWRGTQWLAIVAPRPDVIDDVLWPQMRRARHRLVKELEQSEFHVMRSFEWASENEDGKGELALVFEMEVWTLPPVQRMHGPPITAHDHSARFLEKYGKPRFGPFVDGQGCWFIEKDRTFTTAGQLLKAFLRRPAIRLEESGIPNFIAAAMAKHRLLEGRKFWAWVQKSDISELMWKKYMKKLQ